MTDLTFEQFIGICALLFGIFLGMLGAYNAISTAAKNRREQKQIANSPITQLRERVDRHDELLAKDKDRLDKHDEQISLMGQESKIMLRGVRALLSHEINGNSVDKLRDSMNEIDDYLIARK